MALNINGTTGISGLDGSASAPVVTGTDSNTGLSFGTDIVNINTGGVTRAKIDSGGALDVPTTFPIKLDGTEKLRIDSSGQLGMGTTTVESLVHLRSSSDFGIRLSKTASSDAEIKNTNSLDLCCSSGGSGGQIIRFLTGANPSSLQYVARFTGGKDFQVATTTDEPGNNNTSEGITLRHNGRAFSSMNGTFCLVNRNSSDGVSVVFARQGSHKGNISVDGSRTFYNATSDYRLKENAVAISDGITRLKTLKPYRFNWKSDTSKTVDGFFAHELTAVPEAIQGVKDAVAAQKDVDEGLALKIGDPIYQSIDQSTLVPLLTAALKEAVGKIEVLETKVAALEAA